MPAKSKRRRRARRAITKAGALRLAQRHVLARLFKGAKVVDGTTKQFTLYQSSNWKPAEVWIVYLNPSHPGELKSAHVIAISKSTGRVLYAGPAGDEG